MEHAGMNRTLRTWAERPIIFSGPMVKAILDGRKTMTRRVVKPQPENDGSGGVVNEADSWIWRGGNSLRRAGYGADYVHTGRDAMERAMLKVCLYGQPGDRLWVRETWRQAYPRTSYSDGVIYRADASRSLGMDEYSDRHKWRPSIFMPRAASRITLEITGVRVERLQEISEQDAMAEGAPPSHPTIDAISREYGFEDFPRSWFAQLWDQINAKRAPWSSNPWVWVVAFRKLP